MTDTPGPVLEDKPLDGELIIPEKKDLLASLRDENGLDERERNFLDVLFDEHGGDIRAAMETAGYHHSIPTSQVTKKLGKYIKDRSKEYLIAQTARAVVSLSGVLAEPTRPGSDTIIKASKEILDRGGVFKEEAVQVTEVRNMFILPAKQTEEDE